MKLTAVLHKGVVELRQRNQKLFVVSVLFLQILLENILELHPGRSPNLRILHAPSNHHSHLQIPRHLLDEFCLDV